MAKVAVPEWKIFGLKMWHQVAICFVLGIIVGNLFGESASQLMVFGVIFTKLIKMVVSPLIFFALISGITSLSESHHFGGIALKGVMSYLLTSIFAVSMGLLMATILKPGVGVPIPVDSNGSNLIINASAQFPTIGEFLMNLIPSNIIESIANDNYLQIVIFSIFTGIVMNNIRADTSKIKEVNRELTHVTFKMIEWIVRLAPLAVFGFMASMVGTTGLDIVMSLFRLVALTIGACVFQYLFFGFLILVLARVSPIPFYKKMITTQIMAFSTSSTKATLSTAMRELQDKMGVSESSSNFMMPLGACLNMDGTAIYLGIASVFFAQMFGVDLSFNDYITLMITCTLGSIGAAGIPSGSIIFIGMVLTSVGIPLEGVTVILGVDRILDMFRTVTNITGDAAITLIVDKSEKQLDLELYHSAEAE